MGEATTPKTLRQLLDEAQSAISIYKHPDLDELRPRLNEVLDATGLGTTGRDHITDIDEHTGNGGYFAIRTEYSVRSCAKSDTFYLPKSIVDAADPVQAARAWKHDKTVREAEAEVDRCAKALERARTRLETAKKGASHE